MVQLNGHHKKENIFLKETQIFSLKKSTIFFDVFQAQLNLPHLDTSWNWHPYAMEHVRHCQRGKSVRKKSCARKNCLAETSIDITRLCNTVIPKIEENLQVFLHLI